MSVLSISACTHPDGFRVRGPDKDRFLSFEFEQLLRRSTVLP
ncbi:MULTISPECIES: hypothetical protein [Streptomyces]|nr:MULTISPECIES: hypothetical protein [unclassified Streptomyces]